MAVLVFAHQGHPLPRVVMRGGHLTLGECAWGPQPSFNSQLLTGKSMDMWYGGIWIYGYSMKPSNVVDVSLNFR